MREISQGRSQVEVVELVTVGDAEIAYGRGRAQAQNSIRNR